MDCTNKMSNLKMLYNVVQYFSITNMEITKYYGYVASSIRTQKYFLPSMICSLLYI